MGRAKRFWIFGGLSAVALTFAISSSRAHEREAKLVVGTWNHKARNWQDPPESLYLFADHTFKHEGGRYRSAKNGKWHMSWMSKNPQLILEDFRYGTDSVGDGDFEVRLQDKLLIDMGYGNKSFTQDSKVPEPKLVESERLLLGEWTNVSSDFIYGVSKLKILSSHQFIAENGGFGSWRLNGEHLILDRVIEGESKMPVKMDLTLDQSRNHLEENKTDGLRFDRIVEPN